MVKKSIYIPMLNVTRQVVDVNYRLRITETEKQHAILIQSHYSFMQVTIMIVTKDY